MSVRFPPHPADIIKENLDALELRIAKGTEALGVARSQMHRVVRGESGASPEMALRLAVVTGLTADRWLRLLNACDPARLRNGDNDPTKGLQRLSVAEE